MTSYLDEAFEANRAHLTSVAQRILGSRAEAEDLVQEAWLRMQRTDAAVSANAAAIAMGTPSGFRGREAVASFFNGKAKGVRLVDIDGYAGGAWTLRGDLKTLFAFTIEDGLVRESRVVGW